MEEKEKILERKLNKLELVQNNRNMEYGMGKYTRKLKTNKQTSKNYIGWWSRECKRWGKWNSRQKLKNVSRNKRKT